jgi:hypothetical protein
VEQQAAAAGHPSLAIVNEIDRVQDFGFALDALGLPGRSAVFCFLDPTAVSYNPSDRRTYKVN